MSVEEPVLRVLTNSVITWTTEYYQLAVQQLRGGRCTGSEPAAVT